jgi:hypothetical protein
VFGFCRPAHEDLQYRSLYSRCCRFQRTHYGLIALPFHSYEGVLVYAIASDQVQAIRASIPTESCCRLRRVRDQELPPDVAIGRYCASLSMLLASVKLADDIRDGLAVRARIFSRLLRGKFAVMRAYFQALDDRFLETIERLIEAHLAIERSKALTRLEDFARPTTDAFAYVFSLAHRADERLCPSDLEVVGREIGTAIIAFDCACDWRGDQRRGQFNPVATSEQAGSAIDLARKCLARATRLCMQRFGETSQSAGILRGVETAISGQGNGRRLCPFDREELAMLGLTMDRRYVYARSDCCGTPQCVCACLCCLAVAGCSSGKDVHVFHHKGC